MNPNRRDFLQQLGFTGAGLALVSFAPGCRTASASIAGKHLPRSTPEEGGVSSAGIQKFLEAIAGSKHELHSVMIARHGRVVAEGWWAPYAPQFNHTMYSMSKSFTSTAVGFAVAEGRLTVNDRVVKFFPNDCPTKIGDNLAALRVKDLLTMSVGNEKEPTGTVVKEENWVKTFLAQPITHPPGTVFMYNSTATYMCSAIVQRITGERIVDYLKPRLFDPLAIEGATWETCPRGINTGGWGLSIQTEGLAKFGQLYLQKGAWNGRQILPAKWVEEATTFKIQQPTPAKPSRPNAQNDWLQGYCYQFWRCQHGGFRGDGAFGQFTIVLPEQDAVIVMTGEYNNMQSQLDLVWENLLPAINSQPLAPAPAAASQLRNTLSSLALALPKGQRSSPTAARVSGKTFQVTGNDLGISSTTIAFQQSGFRFTVRDSQGEQSVSGGIETWKRGECSLPGTPPRLISGGTPKRGTKYKVVASGTWKDENTFEITLRYYETPHHDTITCRFDGEKLQVTFLSSIMKLRGAQDSRPVLQGRMTA